MHPTHEQTSTSNTSEAGGAAPPYTHTLPLLRLSLFFSLWELSRLVSRRNPRLISRLTSSIRSSVVQTMSCKLSISLSFSLVSCLLSLALSLARAGTVSLAQAHAKSTLPPVHWPFSRPPTSRELRCMLERAVSYNASMGQTGRRAIICVIDGV